MACAIFISLIFANKLLNSAHPELKKDIIIEFAPLIIIFGILFARLYFCLLNPHYYFTHPLEILDIREGGLSVHGAIIGGVISILFAVKKYRLNFFTIGDPIACATFLGQSLGRWGNYFNSEAYGLPVAGQNWGLFIPQSRRVSEFSNYELHPAFLYESVLDFLSFIVLFFIYKRFSQKYKGLVFFSYLILYSIIRFFIEKLRIDSALTLGVMPIAQVASLILFITGLIGICIILKKVIS